MAVASATAVWYHGGLPPVPLRWVLIRDPRGKFDPQALRCTDQGAPPAQILAWFVLRWRLEMSQPHCPHTSTGVPRCAA